MRVSRRALIGGALALGAVAAPASEARLEAAPLPDREGALGYGAGSLTPTSPGPVLRGRVGAPMTVRLVNRLSQPTSLRLPTLSAEPTLSPGEARDFRFTPPCPGFDLYGPFSPAATAEQASAGLFGALVIDAAAPPPVDLDAVVILFGDDAPHEFAAPPGARVRLRLANAAPELLMSLRASDAAAEIVAIDGQPCEAFAPRAATFPLAPGARVELMFDLNAPFQLALLGAPDRAAVRFASQGSPAAKRPPIASLPANLRLPGEIALERAKQVHIAVTGNATAGYALNADGSDKPLFTVARGAPVALTLTNRTAEPQSLRLIGHFARILHALDDGWDPYWRDALFIGPGGVLHAAFVADSPGRWPLASASARKRTRGMAGWYVVT